MRAIKYMQLAVCIFIVLNVTLWLQHEISPTASSGEVVNERLGLYWQNIRLTGMVLLKIDTCTDCTVM